MKIYASDRFIRDRRLMDFDGAYYKLTEEQESRADCDVLNAFELMRSHKQLELRRELSKMARINDRIFKISQVGIADESHPSMIRLWPCRPRKKPIIRDERVLDLPDCNSGYHFNPIDWGTNDWLATSVANKVLIGKNLDHAKVSTEIVFEYEKDRATAVNWSPDGRNLAFGSETGLILVWHAATNNITIEDVCCFRRTCCINVIHWHPDSKIIAWGCSRGRLSVRSIDGDVSLNLDRAHRGGILNLRYSPGGNYICSSGEDGFLRVWKGTGFNGHMEIEIGNPSRAIAWHPWRSGLLAIGEGPPAPGSLSFWNVNTSRLLHLHKLPQTAAITAMTFNNITGELVFAQDGDGNGTTDIFVLGGPNYVSDSITGINGSVSALMWNADNSKLGTASSDETLHIWNFLKQGSRKRSFNEINEDLTSLAMKKLRCLVR